MDRTDGERRDNEAQTESSALFFLFFQPSSAVGKERHTHARTDGDGTDLSQILSLQITNYHSPPPSPCFAFHTPYALEKTRKMPTVGEKEG